MIAGLEDLTSREAAIARLVARGMTNKQIAMKLGTTAGGVRRSLENIFQKLLIRNRTMLAICVLASSAGLQVSAR
jgi:DNA-binding NarL/FixJ family response regulator